MDSLCRIVTSTHPAVFRMQKESEIAPLIICCCCCSVLTLLTRMKQLCSSIDEARSGPVSSKPVSFKHWMPRPLTFCQPVLGDARQEVLFSPLKNLSCGRFRQKINKHLDGRKYIAYVLFKSRILVRPWKTKKVLQVRIGKCKHQARLTARNERKWRLEKGWY